MSNITCQTNKPYFKGYLMKKTNICQGWLRERACGVCGFKHGK